MNQTTRTFSLGKKALLTAMICGAFGRAQALPLGEQVQAGLVQFVRDANALTIQQASAKSIVNWQSFSIASHEAVQLNQPKQGMALFRVLGNDPTQILGRLNATGSLFLSNPNGVLFGAGAQVDVGSLLATTMRIRDSDFLNSNYRFFTESQDDSSAKVVNQGVIQAADGGYLVLLGNAVDNMGNLTANKGSVVLGSAQSAVLDVYGDGLVRVKLDGDALNAAIQQTGNITADGGAVQLATHARSAAINVEGVIQANSLVERNGVIRLEGGRHAKVSVNGNLSAAGNLAGSQGGTIEVTGEQIALFKNANLDASGDAGGGTVLVGGDLQGKNAQVYNARTTYVDQDAKINVDATNSGNGGKAIVWADNTTRFYGNISAKGGANAGNGGFVEVSGKENLDFIGKVDLSASNGVGGKFLLDPTNIILNTTTQASPTNNANGTPDIAFGNAATNIPIAGTTTVQISDITGYSEAFFQATNDITIASTLTMAANNSVRLEAGNNINVNAALTTSGTGNINLRADADNTGVGNLAIGGNITSQVGGISLSAATITRSAGNISANGAANANAGNINITSTGSTNLGAATVTANGGTAGAGNSGRNGGAITINTGGYTGTGAISASGSSGSGANTNGGNAGSVSLTSSNGISATAATAINATGGNAGATGNGNSGSAGTINMTNNGAGNITTGALASRVGVAVGTGTGGTAASINVTNNASGTLSTGAITTSGNNNSNGNGGNIQLSTTTGNISTGAISSSGGTVRTGNVGKNAGTITINSGGSYTGSTIAASGSSALGTSFSGGNAANITINANTGITATTITATGGNATATNGNGGAAGNITLTNGTSGNISATTITARNGNAAGTGLGGAVGAINITNNAATGTITTGNLSSQGGTFGQGGNIAINGQNNVTVGTVDTFGGTTLTGNAGRNAGSVTINAGGNISTAVITSNGSAGLGTNQNGGNGGAVTLTSGAGNTITHNNISTFGGARTGTGVGGNGANVNVNGNALLSANTIINARVATGGVTSGNVNFGGTINSSGAGRTLAINTSAATTLSGAIGNTLALTSLTTDAGGSTAINGGTVTTTGAQTYNDAVTTSGSTTFNTTNSNVTFGSSIVATGNTVISAGTGTVSAANASNNFNQLSLTAGTANIRDANAIILGASNVTGDLTLRTAGAMTQTGALTVGGVTTLNASTAGDVTLNNTANNFNSVAVTSARDVQLTDANALTINAAPFIRTIDARALGGDLTLGGNIVATGGTPVTSISLSTSQNFNNTGNFNLTPGAGKRWLVYSTNQANDARGTLLTAAYDFKQYNTVIGGTILGTNDGFIYSAAPTITATLAGSANKVYNANTTAPISALTLAQTGAINADTVVLGGLTSATYDNKNVGTNKLVTSNNGINITSATSAEGKPVFGYQLAGTTASGNVGNITQATLNLNAVSDSRVYNAFTTSTGVVTSSGLQGSDTVTGLSQAFDSKNAGSRTLSVNTGYTVNDGNGGNNYIVATNTATGNITQASISAVTGITANNKVYDANTNASLNTSAAGFTGILGSDSLNVATATGAFVDKNAAIGKTVNITGISLGGVDAGNYTLANTTASTTADISQASLNLNAVSDSRVYNALTASAGTVTSSGLQGSDTVTGLSQSFDSKNVGARTLSVNTGYTVNDGNGGNNYIVVANTATGNITQASLNLNAVSDSRVYNALTTSTGAVTSSGLLGSDTVTGLSQSFDSKNAGARTLSVNTGYTVNDGNGGNNYSIITNTATGSITPAAVTLTGFTANDKTYNANNNAVINTTGHLNGVITGDSVSFSNTGASFADKHVGQAKAVTLNGVTLSGTDAGNYQLTSVNTATANIAAAVLTIAGQTANSKVYDGNTTATLVGGALNGVFSGDVVALQQGTGSFVDKNVGLAKPVTVTGSTLSGLDATNYIVAEPTSVTADITPRPITVVANAGQNKAFGAADPLPFKYSVGGLGLVAGDKLSGALARESGEVVGNYAINQGSLSASTNYQLSYQGANFAITQPVTGTNPRNSAGLVNANPKLGQYTNQPLFLLNTGLTAAGESTGGNDCAPGPESLAKDKDFALVLNFGLKLPEGVNASCARVAE
jgi:trimeric autotransporter adhesin